MSGEPTIIAAAESPYTRHPAAALRTPALLADAARRALDDAGLAPAAIDGLGVASFTLAPDHAIDLAVALGLRVSWLMDAATGGAAGIDMLQHAVRAVAAGDAENVLLVAGDVFHPGSFAQLVDDYNVATRDHLAPIPFGGPNALFALLTQRHMRAHGLERADYGRLVVAQRAWAAANPGAVYRDAAERGGRTSPPRSWPIRSAARLRARRRGRRRADRLGARRRRPRARAARRPQRRPARRRRPRDRPARACPAALGRGRRRRGRDRRRLGLRRLPGDGADPARRPRLRRPAAPRWPRSRRARCR